MLNNRARISVTGRRRPVLPRFSEAHPLPDGTAPAGAPQELRVTQRCLHTRGTIHVDSMLTLRARHRVTHKGEGHEYVRSAVCGLHVDFSTLEGQAPRATDLTVY